MITDTSGTALNGARTMRVEYINPFIDSVRDLFTTMLACKVKRGDVSLAGAATEPQHLVAIIGLSGPTRGTVALAFPTATALALVGRLLGETPDQVNDEVTDAMAEVANIVAGGAKARLGEGSATPIELGLPTVVAGESYQVLNPSGSVWLDVPFKSEVGPFNLRVTFELDRQEGGN